MKTVTDSTQVINSFFLNYEESLKSVSTTYLLKVNSLAFFSPPQIMRSNLVVVKECPYDLTQLFKIWLTRFLGQCPYYRPIEAYLLSLFV